MNKKQQAIIGVLQSYPSFPVEQSHLEETIKGAEAELRQAQGGRRTSLADFYKLQIRFIGWKVWAAQLLIVTGMAFLLYQSMQGHRANIQLIMLASLAAPLLVITGIQTLTRSLSHHMLEIELSTYHLLDKLTAVRMSLLGMADLIGLTLIGILLRAWTDAAILDMVFCLLIPFNVACLGCLLLLNRVRTPNCGYYCLFYCGLLVLIQIILSLNPSLRFVDSSAIGSGLVLLLLSAAGMVYEVSGLCKTCRTLETASQGGA